MHLSNSIVWDLMGVTKELQIFCLGGGIGLGIIHRYLEFCPIMFDVAIVE